MVEKSNAKADLRLEIAESANQIGVTKTARLYGVNIRTVVKWQQRFNESGAEGLLNLSRKTQTHPNRLAAEQESLILQTAAEHADWSALKIKKELNLSCTVNTIIKKLTAAGLYRKNKEHNYLKSDEYLRTFSVTVQQIGLKIPEIPSYRICFTDLTTGCSYIGFSRENTALSAAIFADYFLSYLKMAGFDNQNCTFYVQKSRILSSGKNRITAFEDLIRRKYAGKIISSDTCAVSFFDNSFNQIKSEFDLFYYTINKQISKIIQPDNNQDAPSFNMLIAPILTDNYIRNIDDIKNRSDFWQSIEHKNEKRINQVIKKIVHDCEEGITQFDSRKAADIYSSMLILLNNPANREKYYGRSLLKFAEILYYTGEWNKAEEILEKSLLSTCNDQDQSNYLQTIALTGSIKMKKGCYAEAERLLSDSVKIALKNSYLFEAAVLTGKLGLVLQRLGETSKAKYKFKKQLHLAELSHNEREVFEACKNLASIYSFKADYPRTIDLLEQALASARKQNNKVLLAECLGLIGENYFNLFDLDKAETHLKAEMDTALEIKHQELLLHSFGLLGLISLRRADYPAAEKHLEKHLLLAEKLQNHTAELQALRYLGSAGWYMDNRLKAFRYFRRYHKLAVKLQDVEHEAIASGNLGVIYGKSNRFKEARNCYKKLYQLAVKMENRNMVCTALNNMGVLCLDTGDYKNAITNFRKLLKTGHGVIDRLNTCITHHNIALANFRLHRFSIAEKNFRQATQTGEISRSDFYLSEFYCNFGNMMFQNGRLTEAKVLLEKALQHAQKAARSHVITEIEKILNKIS